MPATPPNQKFSLTTAILAELETELRRRELQSSGSLCDPRFVAKLCTSEAADVGAPGISADDLVELHDDQTETRESIDLDTLMQASRSSHPPRIETSSYWPTAPTDAAAADRPPEAVSVSEPERASARRESHLARVVIGAVSTLAVVGAFYAGATLSSWRPAAENATPVAASSASEPLPVQSRLERAEPETLPVETLPVETLGESSTPRRVERRERVAPRARPRRRSIPSRAVAVHSDETAARADSAMDETIVDDTSQAPLSEATPESATIVAASDDVGPPAAEPVGASPAEALGAEQVLEPESAEEPVADTASTGAAPSDAAPAGAVAQVVASPAPEPLPQRPARSDLRRALSSATSAIRACTEHRGTAMMTVRISGAGDVLSASPRGAWGSGADAGCLRRALSGARLPRFRQPELTVQFPFIL